MEPAWSRKESVVVLLLAALLGALYLFAPLFQDRSTLAFGIDDPRIAILPWMKPAIEPLPLINPITPDIDGFVLPGLMRARQLEQSGAGPWWDPGQLLGYPLAANMPYPLFSPVRWVLEPFDPVSALDLALWIHLVIAAVLAYRLCRMLGAMPAAAGLGAVGFALSGWMLTHWHVPQILYTSAFWPGQLAALEWLRRGRRWRAFAEGTLFTGLVLLAGFPQVGLMLTAGALFLALIDVKLWGVRNFSTLGAATLCGMLLAGPQLTVTISAYQNSLRSSDEVQAATARRGMPAAALFGAILPEFFGRPSDFASVDRPAPTMEQWLPQRRFLGEPLQNNVVENALYPGAVILLLLILVPRAAVDRRARLMLLLALLCLLGAWIGPYLAPLWSGFERLAGANVKRVLAVVGGVLPLAAALSLQALSERKIRAPVVFTVVLTAALFTLPWLVKFLDDIHADAFARELGGQAVRQVVFLLAALVSLALAAKGLRWLPAVVLAIDLSLLAYAFNPFPVQEEAYPPTRTTIALAERPGRVVVFGTGPNLLPATAATLHGIRSVQGMVPMVPTRTAELLACIEGSLFDMRDPRVSEPLFQYRSLGHPILDLLGVDTVVHADPQLAVVTGWPVLFAFADESVGAVARPTAGPLAFFCGGARVVSDGGERLRLLADGAIDVHATVLLETEPSRPLPVTGEMIPLPIDRSAIDRHHFQVSTPNPGLVVLAEAYDPGWSVSVDGAPAELLIADHALMAVEVGEGESAVEFVYRPPGFVKALVLAGAVALLLILILLEGWRRSFGNRRTDG